MAINFINFASLLTFIGLFIFVWTPTVESKGGGTGSSSSGAGSSGSGSSSDGTGSSSGSLDNIFKVLGEKVTQEHLISSHILFPTISCQKTME